MTPSEPFLRRPSSALRRLVAALCLAIAFGLWAFSPAQAQTLTCGPLVQTVSGFSQTCTFDGVSFTSTCDRSGNCTANTACGQATFSVTQGPPNSLVACFVPGGSAGSAAFLSSLGLIAQEVSKVGMNAAQSQIRTIRDQLQRRRAPVSQPIGYAAEPAQSADSTDSPWQALAYTGTRDAKSPAVTKAAPSPVAPAVQYAAWAQGFVDHERRSGFFNGIDAGRRTNIGGGIGGIDGTMSNFFSAGDALLLGLLGGGIDARVRNNDGSTAHFRGPLAGGYAVYVKGAFSSDTVFKVDFLDLDTSFVGFTDLGVTNYSLASNYNYKFDFTTWWFEPTVGSNWTRTIWNGKAHGLHFTDGKQVRLQAGARFGTSFDWNGVKVEPVLTALAYSDVVIEGGTISTVLTPLIPDDEGKIFGQLIGKLGFDFGRGFSSYVEGEIRGREHVFGAAGRAGLRYAFQ
jgi:hypothetical protein